MLQAGRTGYTSRVVLTIFHTNDFHNSLSAVQAHRLATLRRGAGADGLLLDAGDAISAGNVTFHRHEPILDLMRAAGYDAMTVGNREFHFTRVGFHCKVAGAGFPILCANVRSVTSPDFGHDFLLPSVDARSGADADPPVTAWIERSVAGGKSVVIFGLTVPMITRRMLSRRVSAYVFDDPIATARALVPTLRAVLQPDLLIALTHIGIAKDRELACAAPEIDLIIGGHTHVRLNEGEWVGATLIAQAGTRGAVVGRIEVDFERLTGTRPQLRAALEAL